LEQFQNPNSKIVERGKGKIDTFSKHIFDRSLSWPGICISIKSGGVKLVLFDFQMTLDDLTFEFILLNIGFVFE